MPSEIRNAMNAIGERARSAAQVIACTPPGPKNRALQAMARQIEGARDRILEANAADLEAANRTGLSSALLDRLELTPELSLIHI